MPYAPRKQEIRNGFSIARVEWERYRRHGAITGIAYVTATIGLSAICGVGAFLVATAVDGRGTIPVDTARAAATVAFALLLWLFSRRTQTSLDSAERDHLFVAVTPRAVALGKVLFAFGRIAHRVALPTSCLAVGFALGASSPVLAITISVAAAGFVALAVPLGWSLGFLAHRVQRHRLAEVTLSMLAFAGSVVLWFVVFEGSLTTLLHTEWLRHLPPAWFVDLAVLGLEWVPVTIGSAVGAGVLTLVGVPVLTVTATSLAARMWTTETNTATVRFRTGSRSLVGDGLSQTLFGDHVSRPTLTVARKRWLQERRVPRGGLVAGGYLLPVPAGIGFLEIADGGGVSPLGPIVGTYIVAVGTGVAFGQSPIGTEYSSLPATLTSVSGSRFVRGRLLAGVAVGAPVAAVVGFSLGIGSPAGPIEAAVIALLGALLCLCCCTIGLSMGLRVPYRNFTPVPLPFTNATVYAERGAIPFVRMGAFLIFAAVVYTPAFFGYAPSVGESIATTMDTSSANVRLGSLVVTGAAAVLVSRLSYRHAVKSYDQYHLP